MYSNPHPSEKLKQIFKSNLHLINNYKNTHDGKEINYQEKLKEILNDKNQYAALVKNAVRYYKKNSMKISIRACFREAIRDAILDYTLNNTSTRKYLKSDFKCTEIFSYCINTRQNLSHLRDEKYTDELHDEIRKYINDEMNNHCDNGRLFDHKEKKIIKAVDAYTIQHSPIFFHKPLKAVIESFVDNGCPLTEPEPSPLTMANQ